VRNRDSGAANRYGCPPFPVPEAEYDWHALAEDSLCHQRYSSPVGMNFAGFAVDLGTTHIRCSIWDLPTASRLGAVCGFNPQIRFGKDVLTRLEAASLDPGQRRAMSDMAARAIGAGLGMLSARLACGNGSVLNRISHGVIVGNSAMLSLLTGLHCETLLRPDCWNSAIDVTPADPFCLCAPLGVPASTRIDLVPPLGGFVGSDLLAGVAAAGMIECPEPSLYMDFGTNTEIALWDGERLWVTSTPGGPAFEICGFQCGMSESTGAIYRFDAESGYRVIGGAPPRGICGSGFVDLIADLCRKKQLTRSGHFSLALDQDAFVLVREPRPIGIFKGDVDAFQRGKAAVGAATGCLLSMAAMRLDQLRKVYICGEFGINLNIENAQTIGLLPDVEARRIELNAGGALAGAERMLFLPGEVDALRGVGQVYNLAFVSDFEDRYIRNLMLDRMRL